MLKQKIRYWLAFFAMNISKLYSYNLEFIFKNCIIKHGTKTVWFDTVKTQSQKYHYKKQTDKQSIKNHFR